MTSKDVPHQIHINLSRVECNAIVLAIRNSNPTHCHPEQWQRQPRLALHLNLRAVMTYDTAALSEKRCSVMTSPHSQSRNWLCSDRCLLRMCGRDNGKTWRCRLHGHPGVKGLHNEQQAKGARITAHKYLFMDEHTYIDFSANNILGYPNNHTRRTLSPHCMAPPTA